MQVQGGVEVNSFKVEIYIDGNWSDYSRKAVFPIKWANLLDERLDEGYITLKNVLQEIPFRPFTPIRIQFINHPECKRWEQVDGKGIIQDDGTVIQNETLTYFIATDTVNNYPVGTKCFTHDIYFIEETKILERFIGEPISFTNALGNNYIGDAASGDPIPEPEPEPEVLSITVNITADEGSFTPAQLVFTEKTTLEFVPAESYSNGRVIMTYADSSIEFSLSTLVVDGVEETTFTSPQSIDNGAVIFKFDYDDSGDSDKYSLELTTEITENKVINLRFAY